VKLLYVNHTGQVSGGERSLLAILQGVSAAATPLVACPDGPLADALANMGIDHVGIPATDGSLKLHPRHTTCALWRMTRGALAVRSIAREHRISLIHANSIRAGIFCTLAARLGAPPTVVHVRDRLPASRVSSMSLRLLGHADALVANSRYTAASLDEAGVTQAARVLANPVDLLRFAPERVDRRAARLRLGLARDDFVAVMVAQITPWKGQEEAIRAIAEVRTRHPQAKLLLAGSAKFVSKATRYDNRAYLASLERLVAELGLSDSVRFLGECEDVPAIMRASDVLLVPSWEEPFGRSVVEAMAMGLPVVATTIGGPAEVITDGHDGLLVEPRQPELWAGAITRLLESRSFRDRLAANGRLYAQAFSIDAHTRALLHLYDDVLGTSGGRRVSSLDSVPAVEAAA
jgi:glycosyltransferase involved in cell wall biosynthesis